MDQTGNVRCPICAEQGLVPERVYGGGGTSTAMCVESYWDAAGDYHYHDPNWHTASLRCTNGHRWTESEQQTCPRCEFGQNTRTVTRQDAAATGRLSMGS